MLRVNQMTPKAKVFSVVLTQGSQRSIRDDYLSDTCTACREDHLDGDFVVFFSQTMETQSALRSFKPFQMISQLMLSADSME